MYSRYENVNESVEEAWAEHKTMNKEIKAREMCCSGSRSYAWRPPADQSSIFT